MSTDLATSSVLDNGRLTALKRQAKAGDPAAAKEVAKQFESLFMQMVLKSMRDAVPREGLFDSQASRLYESLHDQQLSLQLGGGRGLGLAEMIEKQLTRENSPATPALGPLPLRRESTGLPLDAGSAKALRGLSLPPAAPQGSGNVTVPPAPTFEPGANASAAQRAFVDRLMPAAMAAERQTGVPAHFMVAQAALETGWGRAEPSRTDGSTSFNIFGIKAGRNWQGDAVEASTTEVIAGLAQSRVERFRAYGSYDEAFRDYANLLAGNPRYAAVLGTREPQQFARGLQAAGYATDPGYAGKLERIIGASALRHTLPT
jgi:flagellar protein FlgJ